MTTLDYSTVLAIGIHDMKNSLNRVLASLDELLDPETGECPCAAPAVAQLHYEARRMKDNLTKMLMLYRNEHGLYEPSFVAACVYDVLEDCWLNNKPMLDQYGVACQIDADEELVWTMDQQLVESLVENVLTNTVRYTKSQILLRAWADSDWLRVAVEDDGPGFPAGMLGRRALEDSAVPNEKLGHTGLGLHFCALVADRHAAADGRRGTIELSNAGLLGGGHFLLNLPSLD